MNNAFHENKQKPCKFLDTLSLKRTKSNWKCYKRTCLLTPLPNINFPGVTLGNILYLFLSAWRSSQEDIKHLQNNLSPSRSQGIIKQKRPAIYDKASLRKDICKRFAWIPSCNTIETHKKISWILGSPLNGFFWLVRLQRTVVVSNSLKS